MRISMKQYVQRKIREDNLDLTYEMVQVLGVLWSKGELNQQEIADNVQKNKASLTSLLDNLAKRNLIVRTEDPHDRRNKIISLTETGSDHKSQIEPLLKGFYECLQSGINPEELKQICCFLEKMDKNIQ